MLNGAMLRRVALALVLPTGVLLAGGCQKEESKAPSPSPAPSPATQPAAATPGAEDVGAEGGVAAMRDEARRAAATQPASSGDPLPGTPGAPSTPAPAPETPAPATPGLPGLPAPAAGTPGAPGAPAASAAPATGPSTPGGDKTAEAQKLLDQAMTYIKENKYDLAEKTLNQLDGMKASLPAEWPPRIDTARKALATAKAGGGVKLPEGIPGLK